MLINPINLIKKQNKSIKLRKSIIITLLPLIMSFYQLFVYHNFFTYFQHNTLLVKYIAFISDHFSDTFTKNQRVYKNYKCYFHRIK